MRTYILRRTLLCIPLLFGMLTINFLLIHAAPGDPTDLYENPDMSPEARRLIREAYGLDQPLPIQYVKYLKSVLIDQELGYSIAKKADVKDVIADAIPYTIQLTVLSMTLQLGVGILIGIIAAARQYSTLDNTVRVSALTLYSMPSFYLGLVLMFLFAGGVFHWLPAGGISDIVRYDSMGPMEKVWDRLVHLALPTITLGIAGAAGISRYMRGQLLEVIRQDYMRTARAKGLTERAVVFKHGLRNALMPIVTLIGLSLPILFSGAFIIETVFALPGMGRIAVEAALQRDHMMFTAVNVIFAAMVLGGNLLADILYAVVDPRVRLS